MKCFQNYLIRFFWLLKDHLNNILPCIEEVSMYIFAVRNRNMNCPFSLFINSSSSAAYNFLSVRDKHTHQPKCCTKIIIQQQGNIYCFQIYVYAAVVTEGQKGKLLIMTGFSKCDTFM